MTRIPIIVVRPPKPQEPLHLRCSRDLALKLGALKPGYFLGTLFKEPVIMVIPHDRRYPGLVWPVQAGAYLGTQDKV